MAVNSTGDDSTVPGCKAACLDIYIHQCIIHTVENALLHTARQSLEFSLHHGPQNTKADSRARTKCSRSIFQRIQLSQWDLPGDPPVGMTPRFWKKPLDRATPHGFGGTLIDSSF